MPFLAHSNASASNLQTQIDHELVCGAFKYHGTVRAADGLIILRREPVSELVYIGVLY